MGGGGRGLGVVEEGVIGVVKGGGGEGDGMGCVWWWKEGWVGRRGGGKEE